MTLPSNISPALADWVSEVLGPDALGSLAGNLQAAVALAEARGRGRADLAASDSALEAWAYALKNWERSVLQARVALFRAAKASGWDEKRLATAIGAPAESIRSIVDQAEEELERTHPSNLH